MTNNQETDIKKPAFVEIHNW